MMWILLLALPLWGCVHVTGGAVTTYHAQSALQRVELSATLPVALGGLRLHTLHLDYEDADVQSAQARQAATTALAHRGAGVTLLSAEAGVRSAYHRPGPTDQGRPPAARHPGARCGRAPARW